MFSDFQNEHLISAPSFRSNKILGTKFEPLFHLNHLNSDLVTYLT